MTIYRLFTIEEEYIPSDYVDEDGYIDDYYDEWKETEITLAYCDNKETVKKWLDSNCDEKTLFSEDVNIEEIEVLEEDGV